MLNTSKKVRLCPFLIYLDADTIGFEEAFANARLLILKTFYRLGGIHNSFSTAGRPWGGGILGECQGEGDTLGSQKLIEIGK